MTERTFQESHIQEQVIHDPRFSYLAEMVPACVPDICRLLELQKEDPLNYHSRLWLTYLNKVNFYAGNERPSKSANSEDIQAHIEGVSEALYVELIHKTSDLPITKDVIDLVEFIEGDPYKDDLYNDHDLAMSIPGEIMRMYGLVELQTISET